MTHYNKAVKSARKAAEEAANALKRVERAEEALKSALEAYHERWEEFPTLGEGQGEVTSPEQAEALLPVISELRAEKARKYRAASSRLQASKGEAEFRGGLGEIGRALHRAGVHQTVTSATKAAEVAKRAEVTAQIKAAEAARKAAEEAAKKAAEEAAKKAAEEAAKKKEMKANAFLKCF